MSLTETHSAPETKPSTRREELARSWDQAPQRTVPADRPRAEEALRHFYDAIGYLGPLRSVIWADSFSTFRDGINLLERDFCWLLLHREIASAGLESSLIGRALQDTLPDRNLVIGWHTEMDEWDEEEIEVPERIHPQQLVPSVYSSEKWKNCALAVLEGSLKPHSPLAHSVEVLSHCAAFFPGPSMAVCCEFPSEIQLAQPFDTPHPFLRLCFRNGETQFVTPWGSVPSQRKWDTLRQWRTLPADHLLTLEAPFQRPLIESVGFRPLIERAELSQIMSLPDIALRQDLIGATSAQKFLDLSRRGGLEVQQIGAADDYGRLLSISLPDDEDYRVVEVLNSTPEPDGSFKNYYLRVPPSIQSAREAVAWTFDLPESEYDPFAQT